MKTKIFTFFLALAASVGTMRAVIIDGIAYNLNNTTLTAEVTSGAYYGDIVIPESVTCNQKTYRVTSIGSMAFFGQPNITSVTIPNSVTSLANEAFRGCYLTSIEIPNSVTSIGDYAFFASDSLASITIPNSVTTIGYAAFDNCKSLTSPIYSTHLFAYLPKSYSGAYTIPDGIKTIAGGAFWDCASVTSITIPNSVDSIGMNSFFGCTGLTSPVYNDH